jgi:hypothetical protein
MEAVGGVRTGEEVLPMNCGDLDLCRVFRSGAKIIENRVGCLNVAGFILVS